MYSDIGADTLSDDYLHSDNAAPEARCFAM